MSAGPRKAVCEPHMNTGCISSTRGRSSAATRSSCIGRQGARTTQSRCASSETSISMVVSADEALTPTTRSGPLGENAFARVDRAQHRKLRNPVRGAHLGRGFDQPASRRTGCQRVRSIDHESDDAR